MSLVFLLLTLPFYNNVCKCLVFTESVLIPQYYHRLCGAVLSVQRCFRSWSVTKRLRGDYLALRRAAVVVQAVWRGVLVRRQFNVSLYLQCLLCIMFMTYIMFYCRASDVR